MIHKISPLRLLIFFSSRFTFCTAWIHWQKYEFSVLTWNIIIIIIGIIRFIKITISSSNSSATTSITTFVPIYLLLTEACSFFVEIFQYVDKDLFKKKTTF